MKRPRPSKYQPSSDRAVRPGLLVPAGLAEAASAGGEPSDSTGREPRPVQPGAASAGNQRRAPDTLPGIGQEIAANGAVTSTYGAAKGSGMSRARGKIGLVSSPNAGDSAARSKPAPSPLTPARRAPCADHNGTPVRQVLPERVVTVTDARYPDRWLTDRRLVRLTDRAHRVFVTALTWSVNNRTDGRIEAADVDLLPTVPDRETRAELVQSGLWRVDGRDYVMPDFTSTQTTAAQLAGLEQKRAQDRDRQARHRSSKRDRSRDVTRDTEARQERGQDEKSPGDMSDDEWWDREWGEAS